LEALFVQSWDTYLQAKDEQAHLLTLQEFIDKTLTESATAPVTMTLDEITTESAQFAAFVSDQVTKYTPDKLSGQISQLKKKLQ
jgi:hypothetical protein